MSFQGFVSQTAGSPISPVLGSLRPAPGRFLWAPHYYLASQASCDELPPPYGEFWMGLFDKAAKGLTFCNYYALSRLFFVNRSSRRVVVQVIRLLKMKYTFAVFASIATAVIAQSTGIPGVPQCSLDCLEKAFAATGCQTTDTACLCQHHDIVNQTVTPCLETSSGCSPADIASMSPKKHIRWPRAAAANSC